MSGSEDQNTALLRRQRLIERQGSRTLRLARHTAAALGERAKGPDREGEAAQLLAHGLLPDIGISLVQKPRKPSQHDTPRCPVNLAIVTREGHPILALGSPGGSTIITTVLQTLVNDLDFGMTLPEAIATPRASQRNTTETSAEPAFLSTPEAKPLVSDHGQTFTSTSEIGAATGIAFLPGGTVQAAAEPIRRGGGSALVENP
jgi:hypothetical protein